MFPPIRGPSKARCKGLLVTLVILQLVLTLALANTAGAMQESSEAHFVLDSTEATTYLLELKEEATAVEVDALCDELAGHGVRCRQKYYNLLKGCAAKLTPALKRLMSGHAKLKAIHDDRPINVQQQVSQVAVQTQSSAPWNLDRIDQPALPVDGRYRYTLDGSNVNVYVLDTGIRTDHNEFKYNAESQALGLTGSRAVHGMSAFEDPSSEDCYGHGTHVSGIIGGLTWGVAKNVTMHAVRCIGCTGQGSSTETIAGLDWLAANWKKPAIASMSLGSATPDELLDEQVAKIVAMGITVVVAANNFNLDACGVSPARVPSAITVAASDSSDTRWPNSGYGACVDLYAPGVNIVSAMKSSADASISATGTSMACPMVSGVAALYLQNNTEAPPAEVQAFMTGNAVPKVIQNNIGETPNLLLQTDLLQIPEVVFTPQTLKPVVIFESTFAATANQTVTLSNKGNSSVNFQVAATPEGVSTVAGWLTPFPGNGTIKPRSNASVVLRYDGSQLQFQGTYAADVLFTTNAKPIAKDLLATIYIFCSVFQPVPPNSPHSVAAIGFSLLQDTRPEPPAWPVIAPEPPHVYVEITISFSHPVATLPNAAVSINDGDGVIESITSDGPRGILCSDFIVHAKVPFSPWATQSTTVCVSILGEQVKDVYGTSFPDGKNCSTLDHRPVGKLLSPYMAFDADEATPVTSQQNAGLVAVFSEPVTGLAAASFKIVGPASATVASLKPVRGTQTYYHVVIGLPGSYYGAVNVSMTGNVLDSAGQQNHPVQTITFTRVQQPLLEGSSFKIITPPSAQS